VTARREAVVPTSTLAQHGVDARLAKAADQTRFPGVYCGETWIAEDVVEVVVAGSVLDDNQESRRLAWGLPLDEGGCVETATCELVAENPVGGRRDQNFVPGQESMLDELGDAIAVAERGRVL
jgi:hypothetical protein